MKVIESNAGLLSNFEVLELLRQQGAAKGPLGGSVTPCEYKVYEYLVETPAGTQTKEVLQEFVKEVKSFKLMEAERLQSVNLRPSTAVEVHLIVEDCDERLSSEAVDALIQTVERVIPNKSSEGGVQSTGIAIRPPITTHVLDVSLGKPGAGIDVKLERCIAGEGENSSWDLLGSSNTNSDGRCEPLMEISNHVQAGTYRLTFETGKYVERTHGEGKAVFCPYVHVVFEVQPHQVSEHFHVPLLFAPYSYTTYRGS
ncbi:hypothetical protein R1sor_011115 [Riccia sorocarpa]|uniref:DNA-directed RNA polymerase III subunit RPC9 n=1 Tax=Riccia sorocarpa TaxID=122646 RepID=A0ABD3I610_9MARC